MSFETLFNRISPRIKRMAKSYKANCSFLDEDDLYQEMCIHLWNNFKEGLPGHINDAYVVRGCNLYLLNVLRKEKEKVQVLSLENPFNEDGNTLKDVLPDTREPFDSYIEKKITIEDIKNNGFSRREKKVFTLRLSGFTLREIGKKLGISHVMVLKIEKKFRRKCQKFQSNKTFLFYNK